MIYTVTPDGRRLERWCVSVEGSDETHIPVTLFSRCSNARMMCGRRLDVVEATRDDAVTCPECLRIEALQILEVQ